MRRYNIVSLILLILSVNFALAAPVRIAENCQECVDVVHVPKGVITVLGKRGDNLEKMMKLFENFDRWWWEGLPESSQSVRPPSSSAPSKSGHGPMQVHAPPAPPPSLASSAESDQDPEPLVGHPPTPGTGLSTESDLEQDALPPSPESSIESVHSSPEGSTGIEHWYTPPSSPGSDSDSDRWSTISNAPSAGSLFENLQTANEELKLKGMVSRRITGTARGAVNAAQSELQHV
ncbi:hypothetical protein BGY98DRAFT_978613 [Russula aff. rugulosa BPL654]|nr:hypothetical protein BGY98DRAFT_978613 [Russula aff. rugulosa BPL654]